MFTGIVEEVGEITAADDLGDAFRFTLHASLVTEDAKAGDSIAVNGVCLTVVDLEEGTFTADVMAETLACSGLGRLHLKLSRQPGTPHSSGGAARRTSGARAR